jgi:hypothetical protein
VSIRVSAEVDPVIVVKGEAPGSHLRGERAIVLPAFAGLGIDGIEKKGSIELTAGEIKRIPGPVLSGPGEYIPADSIPYRDAEIAKSICSGRDRGQQGKHEKRNNKERRTVHQVRMDTRTNE